MESVRFGSLDELFDLSVQSDHDFEYTMSWVDCLATGKQPRPRPVHARQPRLAAAYPRQSPQAAQRLGVPFDLPGWLLNGMSREGVQRPALLQAAGEEGPQDRPFDPFFYPARLDQELEPHVRQARLPAAPVRRAPRRGARGRARRSSNA